MTAQVFEVDEDIVEIGVGIRIILRHRQQQIIWYELDRLVGVCECESGVARDFRLIREPNLFRRLIPHLGYRVAPAPRAGSQGPSIRQGLSLPYLCKRILSQVPVEVSGENVVPAGGVPQLPGDRVKTWTCAPRKLLGRQLLSR